LVDISSSSRRYAVGLLLLELRSSATANRGEIVESTARSVIERLGGRVVETAFAALANGSIAGYIVADPFNALAELSGVGKILRFTGDVWSARHRLRRGPDQAA
jgi:ABC-type nitrate/sulfonate/bicarbonate transport system substrate-binding protein